MSPWSPRAVPHTTAWSGVSSQAQAGLVDDLLHRARLGHRLLERPPVGGEHRPDHRPGHRHRRHRLGDDDDHDAARDRGRAEQRQARDRDVEPGDDARRRRPTMASTPRPVQRGDDLARLLAEPAAVDDVVLERRVEVADLATRTWAGPSGADEPPSSPVAERSRACVSASSSAGPIGRRALRRALRLDLRVARVRARCRCRPSCRRVRAARPRPRGTRSGRARRGRASPWSAPVATWPPSMTIAPDAAVRSGGGAGIRTDGSSR